MTTITNQHLTCDRRLLTAGPVSVAYACLAAASVIAATVFGGLLPGPAGAAGATAAAAGTAGAAGAAAGAPPAAAATAATAATAAAAAVDWLDVALRTANGLAAGGAARAQVLQALQVSSCCRLDRRAQLMRVCLR